MQKYLAKNCLCCGLIAAVACLLWGRSVHYGFVWDDAIYIAKNKSIRSLANLPGMFFRQADQSAEASPTSYRPVRNVVYALLYAMDGHAEPRPWIFHLTNILAQAVVSILLFLMALLLWVRLEGSLSMPARFAALLVALGFAVHPVNSEVVCWAKSLDDMLAAAFVLAAAISLLKWPESRYGYAAALVWFLLAAFSKESAVPFALAVFFILYGFHKMPWQRSAKLSIPFFAVALFYVVCRHLVMGRSSQCPPLSGSYGQTLIDMFPVVPEYLRLLCGIPPFCVDYNFMVAQPPHPFLTVKVLWGVFLVVVFCALGWWMWRRPTWRISGFGFIWIALFLLPVWNFVPMMQYMAERFLYLPLIGFLLALAGVLLKLSRLRVAAAVAASALVVIWAGASMDRMGIWRDELTLFVRTEMEHPGIKRVEKNVIDAIFQLPQIKVWKTSKTLSPAQAEQMIDTLKQARKIYPENDILSTQLGMTYAKIGQWRQAIFYLELAARQNPDSAERWYDLASICRLAGERVKAQEACARALGLNPKYEEAQKLQAKLESELKEKNK